MSQISELKSERSSRSARFAERVGTKQITLSMDWDVFGSGDWIRQLSSHLTQEKHLLLFLCENKLTLNSSEWRTTTCGGCGLAFSEAFRYRAEVHYVYDLCSMLPLCLSLSATLPCQSVRLLHLSCVSELYILTLIYWQSFLCFHRPAHHPVILSMSCQISGNHQAAIALYMPTHNKTSAYIYLQFRKQSGIFAGLIVKSPVVIIGISHTAKS